MSSRITFLIFTALFSYAASASWVDKLGAMVDSALAPAPQNSKSELAATVAATHNLPAHWRTYWLDEPNFGTRIFLADTGKVNAPTLFLVHGLGQNGLRDWLPLTTELEKNFRVVLLDLPGFANSPSPKTKLSPTYYADLLHFIKPYFDNKPISVVGHSMGGAVTLRYAQRYPDDILQIALIDAAGILQRTAFVKHSATDRISANPEAMPNGLLTHAAGLQNLSNHLIEKMLGLPDPTVILGKSESAWGTMLQNYPNINAALSLTEEDFSSAIYEQQKPVFILWGSKDLIAPPRTAQLLTANLVNSNLTTIAEAGHIPMASHSRDVSQWLLQNLNTQPKSLPPGVKDDTQAGENYDCDNSTGDTLNGKYARITLRGCTGVLLDGVEADELIAHDSVMEIQNSRFLNDNASLTINKSVVMMTGSTIAGLVNLDQARIDFAGVDLAIAEPFIVKGKSRLVLSVNRAGNNRYLHSDQQLENITY